MFHFKPQLHISKCMSARTSPDVTQRGDLHQVVWRCMGSLFKHWSSTQTTVALSSGEAELGGICRGAAIALGLHALAKDLGIQLKSTFSQMQLLPLACADVEDSVKPGICILPICGFRRDFEKETLLSRMSWGHRTQLIC